MNSNLKENIFDISKNPIKDPNKHIIPELIDTVQKIILLRKKLPMLP